MATPTTTFPADSFLVGMFNPITATDNTGFDIEDRAFVNSLTTPAGWSLTHPLATRCTLVARELLHAGKFDSDPLDATVCVYRHRDAASTAYSFNRDRYALIDTIDYTNIDAVERSFSAKISIFEKAFKDYQEKVNSKPPAAERDLLKAFEIYQLARKGLEKEITAITRNLDNQTLDISHYLQENLGILEVFTEKTLAADFIDNARADVSSGTDFDKAEALLITYTEIREFLRNQGRYLSTDIKREFLSDAVFNLSDALDKLTAGQKRSLLQPSAVYLGYQADLRTSCQPLSNADFNRDVRNFLFDRSAKEPSQALQRAAKYNPAQKQKLEKMTLIKQEALERAQPGLVKRGVHGIVEGYYSLEQAIKSLSKDRFRGVEDILRTGIGTRDDWIPSRPQQEFLSDDDPELEALAQLPGRTPAEVETRKLAIEQIAIRTLAHLEQAFEGTLPGQQRLDAHLLHAQEARNRAEALDYMSAAQTSLESDVYPRLQTLGTLDHGYPEESKTRIAFAPRPAGMVYKKFTKAQELVDEKVSRAYTGVLDIIPIFNTATAEDRIASATVLDDLTYLKQSLPQLNTTAPSGAVTQRPYPRLTKVNEVALTVDDVMTRTIRLINTERTARAIGQPQALPPMRSEVKTLLETMVANRGTKDIAEAALGALDNLPFDPTLRVHLLFSLHESATANNLRNMAIDVQNILDKTGLSRLTFA